MSCRVRAVLCTGEMFYSHFLFAHILNAKFFEGLHARGIAKTPFQQTNLKVRSCRFDYTCRGPAWRVRSELNDKRNSDYAFPPQAERYRAGFLSGSSVSVRNSVSVRQISGSFMAGVDGGEGQEAVPFTLGVTTVVEREASAVSGECCCISQAVVPKLL